MRDDKGRAAAESGIWLSLVGSKQGWLERCRRAVSGDVAAIAELEDDHSAAARALQAADTRIVRSDGDPLSGTIVSYDWYVARSIRMVALALAEPRRYAARASLDMLAACLRDARLTSASPRLDRPTHGETPSPQHRSAAVLGEISALPRETQALIELLAWDLLARFPETVGSVTVPVLFAGDTPDPPGQQLVGAGATGKLTLERLISGPSGLHPDPRYMCFLRADDTFAESVQHAWENAPQQLANSCIVWSLRLGTDAAQPVTEVEGGSLGGAFAVALEDLSHSNRIRRFLRPRGLDPRCAISAALSDTHGTLGSVTGLDQKVAAASSAGLRLIVAGKDLMAAQQTPHSSNVHILAAADVHQAAGLARGHLNRRFRSVVAATVAFVLLVTSFAVVLGIKEHRDTVAARAAAAVQQVRDQQQQKADRVQRSTQLANRSGDLLRTDPALAGLAALAGYQTSPTPQSVKAMSAALDRNPQLAKVFPIPEEPGDVVFSPTAAWISAGDHISGYSLTTGQLLSDPIAVQHPEATSLDLVLSDQADRLLAVGPEAFGTYAIDDEQRLTLLATRPVPSFLSSEPMVTFSPDGRRLLILDAMGKGEIWDVAGGPGTKTAVALPGARDVTAVSEATTEPGHDDWTLLLTVTEQAGTAKQPNRLLRWSVDDQQTLAVTGRTMVAVRDVTPPNPALTIATDGGRGLMLHEHGSWRHLPKVTANDVRP